MSTTILGDTGEPKIYEQYVFSIERNSNIIIYAFYYSLKVIPYNTVHLHPFTNYSTQMEKFNYVP
jgi:hypothetical protein